MLNRREFVVATASAAGGLLLAIRFPASAKPRPYEPYPGTSNEVSAWLAIEPDNSVIIRCAQAEMGEGVWKPAKFLQSHPVAYPFLLDEDRSVTKAYGLYHRLGVDAINIAHPASLVIERDRRVEYIYRGDSQTDRAPFDQVLAAVKKLSVSG